MTVKEFYEQVGGSYDTMISRVGNETRILKYLNMFKNDTSMSLLAKCIEEKDFKGAFLAVHTLKGISGNLSLDSFYTSVCTLTEIFRNYDGQDYSSALSEVESKYKIILDNIELL